MSSERPYLIIIPSPLILARTYLDLARQLNQSFHVIVPDLPATGLSRSFFRIWNEKSYSVWLAESMNQMHIKKASILGHSNSGAIAMEFALRFPERVENLILADTTGVSRKNLFSTFVRRFIDGVYEFKFSVKATPHLLANVFLHPFNFFFQIMKSTSDRYNKLINELAVPVYILWGNRDRTIPQDDGWTIRKKAERSFIYVSSNGSHDWILTDSRKASDVIKKYVTRQSHIP